MSRHDVLRGLLPVCFLLMALGACTEYDVDTRQDDSGTEVLTQEPLSFTTQNYDFTGPASIQSVLDLIPTDDFVWHGFAPGSEYPVQGDCDFDRANDQVTSTVEDLPKTIEGIVTLHPRFFQKRTICNQDERFYGTYFLQDSSGGVVVLKDSRVSDFTYGDRVRIRVKGLVHNAFGTDVPPFQAVLAHDSQQIVSRANDIFYEEITRGFEISDIGKVRRIKGVIKSAPTNSNFNEMEIVDPNDPTKTWLVSLDRELGQRSPELCEGDPVTLTGPVMDNFGLRVIIASRGQIVFADQACQNKYGQAQ